MISDGDYCIDNVYNRIVSILIHGEKQFIPRRSKNFYKFWWNEELSLFKQASVEANRAWRAAGKPHSGPIADKRQRTRAQYRKSIRDFQQLESVSYTNYLLDALLRKNGTNFWRCWRTNFEVVNKCLGVEHCVDTDSIAEKFAMHFCTAYTPNNPDRAKSLQDEYHKSLELAS